MSEGAQTMGRLAPLDGGTNSNSPTRLMSRTMQPQGSSPYQSFKPRGSSGSGWGPNKPVLPPLRGQGMLPSLLDAPPTDGTLSPYQTTVANQAYGYHNIAVQDLQQSHLDTVNESGGSTGGNDINQAQGSSKVRSMRNKNVAGPSAAQLSEATYLLHDMAT